MTWWWSAAATTAWWPRPIWAAPGRSVLVLERAAQVGGAAVSRQVFEGVDVRLSAYSYLVSLLPDRIVADLGLELRLTDRAVASYTAAVRAGRSTGLLVERDEGPATATSFRQLTGSDDEFAGWQRFYGRLATLAEDLAPTLTEPLWPRTTSRPGSATLRCGTTCASGRWPTSSPTTSATTTSAASPSPTG